MVVAFRDSIVVSISACHADDPGSIPGRGVFFLFGVVFVFVLRSAELQRLHVARVRGVAVSRLLCMQKAPGSSPGESIFYSYLIDFIIVVTLDLCAAYVKLKSQIENV